MRMPEPKLQRQHDPEEEEKTLQTKPLAEHTTPLVHKQEDLPEEEEEILQTKSNSDETPTATPNLESRINSLKGGGQPLDSATRRFFERRFGYDFSHVLVHTDTRKAEAARSFNAKAFTIGRDIVLGESQYEPESHEGRKLLAHELTHILQQRDSKTAEDSVIRRKPTIDSTYAKCESKEMGVAAEKIAEIDTGHPAGVIRRQSPGGAIPEPAKPDTAVPSPKVIVKGNTLLLTVYFAKGEYVLNIGHSWALAVLNEGLSLMTAPIIAIDGHASTEGDPAFNHWVSDKRHELVEFIVTAGLTNLSSIGGAYHGATRPAVDESGTDYLTRESKRRFNRRVTVLVTELPVQKPSLHSSFEAGETEEQKEKFGPFTPESPEPAPSVLETIENRLRSLPGMPKGTKPQHPMTPKEEQEQREQEMEGQETERWMLPPLELFRW